MKPARKRRGWRRSSGHPVRRGPETRTNGPPGQPLPLNPAYLSPEHTNIIVSLRPIPNMFTIRAPGRGMSEFEWVSSAWLVLALWLKTFGLAVVASRSTDFFLNVSC